MAKALLGLLVLIAGLLLVVDMAGVSFEEDIRLAPKQTVKPTGPPPQPSIMTIGGTVGTCNGKAYTWSIGNACTKTYTAYWTQMQNAYNAQPSDKQIAACQLARCDYSLFVADQEKKQALYGLASCKCPGQYQANGKPASCYASVMKALKTFEAARDLASQKDVASYNLCNFVNAGNSGSNSGSAVASSGYGSANSGNR